MLIETLFFRLFEPDQSEIKKIFQEIVNIHNGAIFKNGTLINSQSSHNLQNSFNLYQERLYAVQENWNQLI